MSQPAKNENPIRLWGGRFTGEIDPLMNQYNESLSVDRVFYAQDIKGSIAYARANVKTGILTQKEFEKLEEGLKIVLKEWDEGKFQPAPGDEGKHSLINDIPSESMLRGTCVFLGCIIASNGKAARTESDTLTVPLFQHNC